MSKTTFRQWVYDKGYRLKDIADALKISRITLFCWMKGTRSPHAKNMMRLKILSKGLFSRPEDLLDETEPSDDR